MRGFLQNLFALKSKDRKCRGSKEPQTRNINKTCLGVETLEGRDMPSVVSLGFSGNVLVVKTDNASTSVAVAASASNIVIKEQGTGRSWSYAANRVGKVEFRGGAGNDRFVDNVASLPIR